MNGGERAQSEVIGVVLLLAITIAAITVTVATGSAALALVTDDAQSSSVENGMSQLSSQSSLVALGETDARRFDLGSVDGGDLRLDEDAGRVEIRIERENATEEIYNDSIGTLEYRGERRDIAMQGGGVWAMHGDRGRMISPPEYHYRGSTLTFPIVRLTGDETSPSSGAGVVRRSAGNPSAVNATDNPLQDGTVVVEVESRYYEGWYDFFSQRADGDVTKDDANQTTTARLVVPQEIPLDRALSTGMGADSFKGNSEVDEEEYTTGNAHPSPRSIIESELANAEDNGDDATDCLGEETCTAGTYYADEDVDIDDDVTFDTSDGNITIAIDGDLNLKSHDLLIDDDATDNQVRYYIAGDLRFQTPTIGTTSSAIEASRTQFYVNGDVAEDSAGGGNAQIDAIIYAPNADLELNGNVNIRGTVVFNEINVGGNVDIQSDPDLADLTLRVTGGPGQNPITYLHVSENAVEVDFDR